METLDSSSSNHNNHNNNGGGSTATNSSKTYRGQYKRYHHQYRYGAYQRYNRGGHRHYGNNSQNASPATNNGHNHTHNHSSHNNGNDTGGSVTSFYTHPVSIYRGDSSHTNSTAIPYHHSAGAGTPASSPSYTYPPVPYHPSVAGVYPGGNNSSQGLIFSQGLLMPAEASEKTLEWSSGDEFDKSSTPDYIYATATYMNMPYPNTGHHYPLPHRKRFYNGVPREWYDDLDPEEYVRTFYGEESFNEGPVGVVQDFSNLSEEIWLKYLANQQTAETFRKKMELWRDVYRILRTLNYNSSFKHDPRNFPTFGLQVVGSTMSGFGSNTSDVDMCLLIRSSDVDQRYEAVDKLQILCGALCGTQWLDNVDLIYAKVPLLKFRDPKRCLEVDLNCNNFVGIRNTHLLYCYSQADWRLKPLVLVVKLWAQFHGINDAKNMTISSYSLVLMVIHFLQCGVEEPVLPILQQMYPEKFSNTVNILHVKINEVLPMWQSKNNENLGNLLIQFLDYYANKFDYSKNALSVRTGGNIPIKVAAAYKSIKNDPYQWKYLCIEEPFDRTNTARSVYDRETFNKILGIFNLSYQRLLASRNLESIFTQISDTDARTMSVLIR